MKQMRIQMKVLKTNTAKGSTKAKGSSKGSKDKKVKGKVGKAR